MTLVMKYDAGSGSTVAAVHSFVHISSHVRPVVVSMHGFIHRTFIKGWRRGGDCEKLRRCCRHECGANLCGAT